VTEIVVLVLHATKIYKQYPFLFKWQSAI